MVKFTAVWCGELVRANGEKLGEDGGVNFADFGTLQGALDFVGDLGRRIYIVDNSNGLVYIDGHVYETR